MNVVDKNGLQGEVVQEVSLSSSTENWVLLHFSNGQLIIVPTNLLVQGKDGRYHLTAGVQELLAKGKSFSIHTKMEENPDQGQRQENSAAANQMQADSAYVIPVMEEKVTIQKRNVESAVVAIHKLVQEHTEVIDEPLDSEEVEIERVQINRIVEAPIPPRYEGDTMIISLLEEHLVVEKRLLLREEVRIAKVHKEVHNPKEVHLRKEQVEIERKPGSGQGLQQDETTK